MDFILEPEFLPYLQLLMGARNLQLGLALLPCPTFSHAGSAVIGVWNEGKDISMKIFKAADE